MLFGANTVHLQLSTHEMTLDRPRVMGILNVTPDSFADGGRFNSLENAEARARQMCDEGADIIDIGGESTHPGAEPVSLQQELDRVMPVIERLAGDFDAPISIDTSKPTVMREAIAAGASMINDVAALREPGALEAAAELQVPVCLMHMQGAPRTMQQDPRYDDVVDEVARFLEARAQACIDAGLARDKLIVDPGFGFGKTLNHNIELLRRLDGLIALGYPVLVGLSRKSMIAKLVQDTEADRLAGSLAAAILAQQKGAHIIRVHDVAATLQALEVYAALAGDTAGSDSRNE